LGEAYRVARVHEALDIDGDRLLFTRNVGHGANTIAVIARVTRLQRCGGEEKIRWRSRRLFR
jgi:hypothetical protein